MASAEDPTGAAVAVAANIFNEDEDLLEDDDEDSFDRDEDDSASSAVAAADLPPPSSSVATQVTIAVPGPPDPHIKQQQEIIVAKKPAQLDDSRKLFQRLWTDADEIELLQGFLDYTTQRGGPHSSFNHHHHDTTAFYDQIKDKFQLDFNKNQLVEKLRRLKKKYRNVINKFGSGKDYAFKSPHDHATFEISSKIWGASVVNGSSAILAISAPAPASIDEDDEDPNFPNFVFCQSPNPNGIDVNSKTPRPRKRNRTGAVKIEDKQPHIFNTNTNYNQPSVAATPLSAVLGVGTQSVPNLIEETVKNCLSPILKELLGNSMSSNTNPNGPCSVHGFASALSPMPLGFAGPMSGTKMADEKWRKQQILELEVFSKRLELMQDQVKEQLQELRSVSK